MFRNRVHGEMSKERNPTVSTYYSTNLKLNPTARDLNLPTEHRCING